MKSFVYDTSMASGSVAKFAAPIARDSYDATDDRGRRRSPRALTSSEDSHASERRRRMLSATTRDLARNFVIASWGIRKHLDYVADFTFEAATTDEGFNEDYEAWQKEVSKKHRFDAAARHSHRRATRLAEACKTVDGAVHWLKLAPPAGNPLRGAIQAIEDDRISISGGEVPANSDPLNWVNGRLIDPKTTRVQALAICRRVGATRKVLERIVSARNILTHANFEFRFDQVGGISPIAAGLNLMQDTMEAIEYAFAKVKISQLFGIAIQSKSGTSAFAPPPSGDDDETEETSTEPAIPLGRGPFVSELDVDEEAKVIESANPSTETVDFLNFAIMMFLKSLDFPMSFFREDWTNFYGSRGGMIQYLLSCVNKVLDLQELLDDHHRWRVGLAVADGELQLPSGKDFDFLKWEFVPAGVPWFDTSKEVRGAAMSIAAGFTSPQRVCREIGTNYKRNIKQIAVAMKMAKDAGVNLVFADSSAFAPELAVTSNDAQGAGK